MPTVRDMIARDYNKDIIQMIMSTFITYVIAKLSISCMVYYLDLTLWHYLFVVDPLIYVFMHVLSTKTRINIVIPLLCIWYFIKSVLYSMVYIGILGYAIPVLVIIGECLSLVITSVILVKISPKNDENEEDDGDYIDSDQDSSDEDSDQVERHD